MGSLTRGRVIRAGQLGATKTVVSGSGAKARRVVPREELDARAAAEAILEAAKAEADALLARARAEVADVAEHARREAEETEQAKLAAAWLALRAREERRADQDLERAVKLAAVLAERLLGHALEADPATVVALARTALAEARGARRATVMAHPHDADVLGAHLQSLGLPQESLEVIADDTLQRGSLVVQTELGAIDARLRPQLDRLAAALEEAIRG